MTGYESKRAAARDKLVDDDTQVYKDHGDALTIAYQSGYYDGKKAALPAQEPVAWLCKADENGLFGLPTADKACKDCFPVYTAPPQRTWVGLTDEEIKAFDTWHDNREEEVGWCNPSEIVAYIEAKLKEKNT